MYFPIIAPWPAKLFSGLGYAFPMLFIPNIKPLLWNRGVALHQSRSVVQPVPSPLAHPSAASTSYSKGKSTMNKLPREYVLVSDWLMTWKFLSHIKCFLILHDNWMFLLDSKTNYSQLAVIVEWKLQYLCVYTHTHTHTRTVQSCL